MYLTFMNECVNLYLIPSSSILVHPNQCSLANNDRPLLFISSIHPFVSSSSATCVVYVSSDKPTAIRLMSRPVDSLHVFYFYECSSPRGQ